MTDETIRTTDLAIEVGISRQMIGRYAREGLEDYAKVGRGEWHRGRALEWLADRREDQSPDAATPEEAASLTAIRIEHYKEQTRYIKLRNGIAENVLMYRDVAQRAMGEYAAAQLADVDAWARDTSDDAGRLLASKGLSAAEILQVKAEVANGLRDRQSALVRRIDDVLRTVEDVGATRIRLSGSVG